MDESGWLTVRLTHRVNEDFDFIFPTETGIKCELVLPALAMRPSPPELARILE
jgi:hypothetical protein